MYLQPDMVATVAAFEARHDVQGAVTYLYSLGLGADALDAVSRELVDGKRYFTAYRLAGRLIAEGWTGLGTRILRAFLARIFDQHSDFEEDARHLRRHGPARPDVVDHVLADHDGWFESAFTALARGGQAHRVDELGRLFLMLDDRFAPFYDETAATVSHPVGGPPPPFAAAAARALGPVPARRAIVAFRQHYFSGNPKSRLHDLGPRLAEGLRRGGWRTSLHPLRNIASRAVLEADYRALAERCEAEDVEVLVLDEPHAHGGQLDPLLERLGRRCLVSLQMDPWDRAGWPEMRHTARYADLVWSVNPSVLPWSEPALSRKLFVAPFHVAFDAEPTTGPIREVSFSAGISRYNWQRSMWMVAAQRARLPVAWKVSSHHDDQLEPLESYRRYMVKTREAGAVLNFAVRRDFSRTVTDRCFQALSAGALLLQEESDELSCFMTAGEHYLPFRTMGDLRGAFALLRDRPEEADRIRISGARFAREVFSDERLTAMLDQSLATARRQPRSAG